MKTIDKSSKIFLAGHKGLVGNSILNNLKHQGYRNVITRTSNELDLTKSAIVMLNSFIEVSMPVPTLTYVLSIK